MKRFYVSISCAFKIRSVSCAAVRILKAQEMRLMNVASSEVIWGSRKMIGRPSGQNRPKPVVFFWGQRPRLLDLGTQSNLVTPILNVTLEMLQHRTKAL